MDSMIGAAARLLATGDLLGALKRVALREDAPALALRGIVMAQLGDLDRAKILLKAAARSFGPKEVVARARCIVAEAEIALVSRDLIWKTEKLAAARLVLEEHSDHLNAAHARHIEVRRLLLTGHLDAAEAGIAALDPSAFPPASRAAYELVVAGIAVRRLRISAAQAALLQGERSARKAGIPALLAEVERLSTVLHAPAARLIAGGRETLLRLDEVEALLTSGSLVIDACRYQVRNAERLISLTTRPVLFTLARALAERWPFDVSRQALVSRAFRAKDADESHRSRLRVEIGRLRSELQGLADVTATRDGFVLTPHDAPDVVVLAPPVEEPHGAVLALLADGESWSSSALAIALGVSARTVQRTLEALAATEKVQSFGQGPARRWTLPSMPGFPSTLLLPGPLPSN